MYIPTALLLEPFDLIDDVKCPYAIVDVRQRSELGTGVIPGALLLGRDFLETAIQNQFPDKTTPICLYCESGNRSAYAAISLSAIGYSNVSSLQGGIVAWRQAGYGIDIPSMLSPEEHIRFKRQINLNDVGEEGQLKLKKAKVLLVGLGGLGSPCLYYLAAAGVGTLGLADADNVESSNLHRQIVHHEHDLGVNKAVSAAKTARQINRHIQVATYKEGVHVGNAEEVLSTYDLVLDCTDCFNTRYLLSEVAPLLGIPLITASVHHHAGQIMTKSHAGAACYRCIYPHVPPADLSPTCAENGVLGTTAGIIGLHQAHEAIKFLLGIGAPLDNQLLHIDLLTNTIKVLDTQPALFCTCKPSHSPGDHSYA